LAEVPDYNAWGGLMKRIAYVFATLLISAVCFGQTGYPRVVAHLDFVNRSTGVNTAKLYTPAQDGVFRPTIVLTCSVSNGEATGSWRGSIGWTNELGQTNTALSTNISTYFAVGGITTVYSPSFRAIKGVPITLSIQPFGATEGSEYNAYIILEQLE
jgi:hypothetical protein